ncbi:3',5'-cyclic AMP phosphodiesterase CpdA [Dysgonomonas hofstadii]|uniref:acid phosphatase n=1 Tax=Dysgonomonas hofstadii TaxID=637886 RepID=A0A840CFS8_9BACT|nr:metallophosphoesterase [Dysgonomonas hofstadii]MBB4034830.1 3',5'-cyclic AMP phosphodiesterase CpdA [Dysgonomonas hofstadii]
MKRILFSMLILILLGSCSKIGVKKEENNSKLSELPENALNFIVANDLGRNGHYLQKPIANEMGLLAERVDIEFVVAAGDIHHYLGVQSIDDPLWMTNYELIYEHPELQVEWLPILGNHEYQGNPQAVIDYSAVSRRWVMPARYYTRKYEVEEGASLRLVFIDTAPLIDKYRNDEEYSDAGKQDMDRQLQWVDSVLTASQETWKIVVGHHPIYAGTNKDDEERIDMQARLDPILRRGGVDFYICGHIHNFQHIRMEGSDIDYVVNSSGSLSREVVPIEGMQFSSGEAGFSVVSVTPDTLKLIMLDQNAVPLHSIQRVKK